MQITPSTPGDLAVVRTYLGEAQGFAGAVADKPEDSTVPASLLSGIEQAYRAADELAHTEPASNYQDLTVARQQVMTGAHLLEQAYTTWGSSSGVNNYPQVKQLAHEAFMSFEDAFEIIDND
jgi:hypothetical protein